MQAFGICLLVLLSVGTAAGQAATSLLPTPSFNPALFGKSSLAFGPSLNPTIWPITAGAEVLYIEVWGGGGAGSISRGGQGGGYLLLKVPVKSLLPRTTLTIKVGRGGNNLDNRRDGESSTVMIGAFQAVAHGGAGTDNTQADGGYHTEVPAAATAVLGNGLRGEAGESNSFASLAARDSVQLYILEKGGRGGNAGATRSTGGNGGTLIKVAKVPTANTYRFTGALAGTEPERGKVPGGGGGAKPYFRPGTWFDTTLGSPGGDGLVIIYW